MNLSRFKALVLSCVATVAFVGCGGGSDSTSTAPVVATGTFVDAPVQGLKYTTATQTGYTDSNGTYKYVAGEQIEFFLGNLSLGKVTASSLTTPYTMAGDTNISAPSDKAKNIAMLLQNFDANRSDSAVLDLSKLKDHNFSDVNLSATTADMETKITALLGTLNTAGLVDATTHTLINATTASTAMETYVTDYNLQLGYGLSNGVNYVGNLSMTATEFVAMRLQSHLYIEYVKPGSIIDTVFSNHYVSFFDAAGSSIDFSYDWSNSNGGTTDVWNITNETFTAADLANFSKPIVVNSTTYREKNDDNTTQECTIVSSKKVNAIIGISVDAIEVREFCRYGTDNIYGNGEGWGYSGYLSPYLSMTDFLNQLQNLGIGNSDIQLTSDYKVKIKSTGEVIPGSYWKMEDGILKTKYWDEVWYKLGTDGIIVDNWFGDEQLRYVGITKDQAKQITAKIGLPTW
ncbi:MAG: hypothetical protein J0647_04675 [Campylobacteraceae bacterium]|nr:hypothetical protein [Campylobacteraceae bacterium]